MAQLRTHAVDRPDLLDDPRFLTAELREVNNRDERLHGDPGGPGTLLPSPKLSSACNGL